MNKFLMALMALTLIALSSCNNSKKVNSKNTEMVFKIKETPCFGKCPVYEMEIYRNGFVKYTGRNFVEKEGEYQKTISKKEVESLIDLFNEAAFFSLKDEYQGEMTDLPTVYTTFKYEGKSKTIENYYGAPDELRKLENALRAIGKDEEGWEKVEKDEEEKRK